MKIIIKLQFTLIAFFLLGATSCSLIKPVEFKEINSFKIGESAGNNGVFITTNITLYNPNGFQFTINKADIDVYAEGINLGKLKIPEKIEIGSRNDFSGDFYIEISFTKLLLSGRNVISKLKSGQIEIQLKGNIDTKFLWQQKEFKIDYREKIIL